MSWQRSEIDTAASLEDEFEQLHVVLEDLAELGRLRAYADWLSHRDDPRGSFLQSVLDDWDAGRSALPVDDDVDSTWRDTCGVTLLQKLREGSLDSQASAIRSAARPALKLTPVIAESELGVGSSKFGGMPDLVDATGWPEFDGKLHTFVAQFRLEELQDTQAGRSLPPHGLLSFFVFDDPIETGQPAAEGAEGAWQVIHTENLDGLRRRHPPKDFDEGNQLAPECRMRMRETLDLPTVDTYGLERDYADQMIGCRRAVSLGLESDDGDAYEAVLEALLPDRVERSHLLGWSHPQVLADDPVEEGFRHLLTVASEDLLQWCWADAHQLFFSLSADDLEVGRFANCAITDG